MGRQHIRDGMLHVKQAKTGAELWIPPQADMVLDRCRRHLGSNGRTASEIMICQDEGEKRYFGS
jgi:hypothetical protein